MMMTLFDDEQIWKAYAKDIERDAEKETAIRMIQKGKMSLEEIADYVPAISMEELKELKAEVTRSA